ncbi:unnamed protein product [Nippostrongylus brasiliensis]|uniref:RNA-directed RNA polymerase n=1 Tax=Nippostrongylus brasiliensis TaxID=27835 RepID=A0A0N4YRX5_NIPBR|nr:unnamed protein product [Nippostrongylus brasiliensis]
MGIGRRREGLVSVTVAKFGDTWATKNLNSGVTFEQFVDVPALWATNGGAPAVTLVAEELDDFDHTFVELFGTRRKRHGGILSGRRMNSLMGKIASHLVCMYVTREHPHVKWIVLGDDIIMYSHIPNAMLDVDRQGAAATLLRQSLD